MPNWVMPLFVIVASVSLFVQMLIFGAMFLEFRRINRRMEQIVDDLQRRINPIITRLQTIVEEAQPRISSMISDATEITQVARSQVQRAVAPACRQLEPLTARTPDILEVAGVDGAAAGADELDVVRKIGAENGGAVERIVARQTGQKRPNREIKWPRSPKSRS